MNPRSSPHTALFAVGLMLAICGIATTAIAAPLVLSFIFFGPLWGTLAAPIIFVASILTGIPISLPAALVNAIVLSLLARVRVDALPVSLASGALIGACALSFIVRDSAKLGAASEASYHSLDALLVFALTGAIMGALYWLIAILPLRRQRQLSQSAATRTLDEAARDASARKRDRRIPWDGRVPPD